MIKHLTPRSDEELRKYLQKIVDANLKFDLIDRNSINSHLIITIREALNTDADPKLLATLPQLYEDYIMLNKIIGNENRHEVSFYKRLTIFGKITIFTMTSAIIYGIAYAIIHL